MDGKLMRAVQYAGYGGGAASLKHVEIPVPKPNKDEVLLKVEAAALNPVDWKIQKGVLRPILPPKFPFVPATDVTGEVVEVGPGVKDFSAGDKVVAMLSMNAGGLAEYVVANQGRTAKRPAEVSEVQAAGLPMAACTALQALKSAGVRFDNNNEKVKNILITSGSGGVGTYAVQLSKHAGLHVTATCGSRNMDFVKSLGADEVLDYKTEAGASLRSPSGKKYDAVVSCTGGFSWSTFEPNLSDCGKVIDLTPTTATFARWAFKKATFAKKQIVPVVAIPMREDLEVVVGLLRDGKMKTVVDSTYEFGKADEAWSKITEGHTTGKIIIQM